MTPFEAFANKLASSGLELRPQWRHRREQSTWTHYLIYGRRKKAHHDILVRTWPEDGGYALYVQAPAGEIQGDVDLILGEEEEEEE